MFDYDEHNRLLRARMGSDAANEADPSAGTFVQKLTYGLDEANNRETIQEQLGPSASATTTNYSLDSSSNRYESVDGVDLLYDARGSLVYHKENNLLVICDALDRVSEIYQIQSAAQQQAGGGAAAATASPFAIADMSALQMARTNIIQRLLSEEDVVDRANDAELKEVRTEPLASGAVESGGEDVVLVLKAWYLYDASNRRVTRWVGDDATYFYAWDGWQQAQQAVFRDQGGGFSAELRQFVWGEQLDELIAYRRSVDAGVTWQNFYIAEAGAHCPARVLDETGAVVETQEYGPYGQTTYFGPTGAAQDSSAVGNSFGWRCADVDHETGWAYMRNRYYSPKDGRFTTRDPLGVDGDPVTWMNVYNYGSASPLVQADPFGLQSLEWHHLIPKDKAFNDYRLEAGITDDMIHDKANGLVMTKGDHIKVHDGGKYNAKFLSELDKTKKASGKVTRADFDRILKGLRDDYADHLANGTPARHGYKAWRGQSKRIYKRVLNKLAKMVGLKAADAFLEMVLKNAGKRLGNCASFFGGPVAVYSYQAAMAADDIADAYEVAQIGYDVYVYYFASQDERDQRLLELYAEGAADGPEKPEPTKFESWVKRNGVPDRAGFK